MSGQEARSAAQGRVCPSCGLPCCEEGECCYGEVCNPQGRGDIPEPYDESEADERGTPFMLASRPPKTGPGSSAADVDGAALSRGHHESVGERQGRQPGSDCSAATVEPPTCEAEEPISGVQCERPEGHDGAHIFATERTVIAWGWPT